MFFVKNKDFALTEDVAKVLAAIACHGNKLPQGSPCSPVISNLIGQVFDIRLIQLARRHGCSYSRYADDLTFSTNKRAFPVAIGFANANHIWEPGAALSKIIGKCGFQLNAKKTRMQYRDSRQEVTGLIVNRRINTRPEYRRLARAMTHRLITTGKFQIEKRMVDGTGKFVSTKVGGSIHHLQGMFGFIDWVDLLFKKAKGKLDGVQSSIDKTYKRFLMHRDFWANSMPIILCEGKTDSVYLRGAMRRLAKKHSSLVTVDAKGKADYKLRFFNYSYTAQRILDLSGGAPQVKKFITGYLKYFKNASVPAGQQPLVVLVDNDHEGKKFYGLIQQYSDHKASPSGMDDFYPLAANVYVVFTPIAQIGDASVIEDFFKPALLATKLEGKSLNPSNENLDEDTEYSKAVFAAKVVRPNIGKIDFGSFDPILSRIEAVIAHHAKYGAQ